MSIQLRPYQQKSLDRWLGRPDKRLLLAHPMGAGKSYIALSGLRALSPQTALIVVPAVVRPMWVDLLRTHMSHVDVAAVLKGRSAVAQTKASKAAWEAPYRVISYDLLKDCDDPIMWDVIIADEASLLRNPKSQQSRYFFEIMAKHKGPALGLSGTYIPNEAWQLWNPLRTFFPSRTWGRPTSTGDVAWAFKERFCKMELRFGHPYYFGLKNEEDLKALIAPYIDRVTEDEFASYLPPLFVEPLRSDSPRGNVPYQWLSGTDVAHRGIFVHHRKLAMEIAEKAKGTLITGEMASEKRALLIKECATQSESLIVGTMDCLSHGISLTHINAALVYEWTSDMEVLLQFIGRFARYGSIPTKVEIYVGANSEESMGLLRDRINNANTILSAGRSERALGGAVSRRQLTDEEFSQLTVKLLTGLETQIKFKGLIEEDEDERD